MEYASYDSKQNSGAIQVFVATNHQMTILQDVTNMIMPTNRVIEFGAVPLFFLW